MNFTNIITHIPIFISIVTLVFIIYIILNFIIIRNIIIIVIIIKITLTPQVAANAEADVGSSSRRILLMEDDADKSENRLATAISGLLRASLR